MSETIARIIDIGTGEVIKDINEGDKLKVVRNQSMDHLSKNVAINNKDTFIKLYTSILKDLREEHITQSEFYIITVCLEHLNYYSGSVTFANNGEFLAPQDFEKITGLGKATVMRGLTRLVELNILHKGKTGKEYQLFVNPFIFMKGAEINRTLYDMFKKSKWNKGETKRGKR